MAIYEYRCMACDPDVMFERRVHYTKADEQFCRECGVQLRRTNSNFSVLGPPASPSTGSTNQLKIKYERWDSVNG